MSNKNLMKNSGVPVFIDVENVLPAKSDRDLDSWYIACAFKKDGKKFGFEWHQMIVKGQFSTTEFLLMDGATGKSYTSSHISPVDEETLALDNILKVVSPFGCLEGNRENMKLKLSTDKGAVDVSFKVKDDFFAGATGLLNFLGDSYEYAYPNMIGNGTLTIAGEEYEFTNAVAWFDRQYSGINTGASDMVETKTEKDFNKAWLWIGTSIGKKNNMGLMITDVYENNRRNAFATISHEDGTHINTLIDVKYDGIWTSEKTGSSYPNTINVKIPYENIDLTFNVLVNNEFSHKNNGTHGCQCLCDMTGKYKNQDINDVQIVEIIGNLCGE